MIKFVLASRNPGKLKEMNEILSHLGIQVCSEEEAGVDVEVEETGTTFEENSRLKAEAVMKASGLPAIADDSGLCVDCLGGAPGVYSARYGRSWMTQGDTACCWRICGDRCPGRLNLSRPSPAAFPTEMC